MHVTCIFHYMYFFNIIIRLKWALNFKVWNFFLFNFYFYFFGIDVWLCIRSDLASFLLVIWSLSALHTHTHTHIYIYIYIFHSIWLSMGKNQVGIGWYIIKTRELSILGYYYYLLEMLIIFLHQFPLQWRRDNFFLEYWLNFFLCLTVPKFLDTNDNWLDMWLRMILQLLKL